ncbi:MAG: hypothetical protein PWP45_1710 [Tepidanaerobacteraceae bacterium]|nr:hypothetical protein [Tepidanaerobacteraceae bacterium]
MEKIEIIKKFRSRGINLDFLLRIAGIPKSTFFCKPHEEKCSSIRGCFIPGFSWTKNGEIVTDEAIRILLLNPRNFKSSEKVRVYYPSKYLWVQRRKIRI